MFIWSVSEILQLPWLYNNKDVFISFIDIFFLDDFMLHFLIEPSNTDETINNSSVCPTFRILNWK